MGLMREMRRQAERQERKTRRSAAHRKAVTPRREPRLLIEAIEPRYLLSGEGIVVPPPPPPANEDGLYAPIQVSAVQLAHCASSW